MHTPQEINVWYILPAIRREMAQALAKKGLKQREIAKKLGMTEAAVSQYMKNKRAKSVELPAAIKKEIAGAADKLARDENCHRYEVQAIIESVRKSGFLCKVHRKYDTVPACCDVCLHDTKVRRCQKR